MEKDTAHKGFRKAAISSLFPNLIMAESTRHGGISQTPYDSLNLGIYTADSPTNIAQNRLLFWDALGIPSTRVVSGYQIHQDQIAEVTNPGELSGFDAFITNKPNLFVAVTVADCTPILVVDPVHKAVAAIHAGWRGTVLEIVSKTILALQNTYGSNPAECYAFIGTCIDQCSFEVGEEVAAEFSKTFVIPSNQSGKYCIDLKSANKQQLLNSGILNEHIEVSPYSTVLHNTDYFSHRLEKGLTGRMLAVIGFTN